MSPAIKTMAVIGIGTVLLVAAGVSKNGGRGDAAGDPDSERKALAAKIERVLLSKGYDVMAFGIGDVMNLDYARCGQNTLDVVKDVWGDRLKDLGFSQVVCTATGGSKTSMRLR